MTAGALVLLGVVAVADLAVVVYIGLDLLDGTTTSLADAANDYARVGIEDGLGTALLLARVGLDVLVGVLLLVAAAQLLRGRDRRGVELAQGALLLALTLVNVLLFYTDQWVASGAAVIELVVLGVVWRFGREVLSGPGARRSSAAR